MEKLFIIHWTLKSNLRDLFWLCIKGYIDNKWFIRHYIKRINDSANQGYYSELIIL